MIKKYGTYLMILVAGLLLGYFFFGNNNGVEQSAHISDSKEAIHWTCSMHPQVNKIEKGDCPMCGMALVSINGSDNALGPNQFEMSEDAMALANIETMSIGVGDLDNNTLVLSGAITSNEKTNAVQTTIFDGRVEKLNVNYVGEYVKKGQQIGLIYAPDMYAPQDKLLTSASYKDTHQKLWEYARNTLGLWKMTDEQIREVLKTGRPILNFPLIADISGTVTEVLATEGKFYKEGDPLYKVSNLYTVWAVFDAYENQLPFLNMGQDISITSKAFEGKKLEAKISFIEPILDVAKRTVSVRATLNNGEQLLKPGMFVEGIVKVDGANQVLAVPKSAVLWTGKRSLVYIKPYSDKPVFEIAEVVLGNSIGDSYIILEGLTPGNEVVINGTFTVDAAAQLHGKKSMMNGMDSNQDNHFLKDDDAEIGFDSDFQKNFLKIVSSYMELKDALVATNGKEASIEAKQLLEKLNTLEKDILNEQAQSNLQSIKSGAEGILTEKNMEVQRRHFKSLSENMVLITSTLSNLEQAVYVQFCPMADNNKGAKWLSFEDAVLNPYFGDKMLTCGSVIQTIN